MPLLAAYLKKSERTGSLAAACWVYSGSPSSVWLLLIRGMWENLGFGGGVDRGSGRNGERYPSAWPSVYPRRTIKKSSLLTAPVYILFFNYVGITINNMS